MNSFLFVTDLDNTLVGDDQALIKLNRLLSQQQPKTKIVYATGRSLTLYQQLLQTQTLLQPNALIAAVGTEIYFNVSSSIPDSTWSMKLANGWNREAIVEVAEQFSDLTPQPESEQRPFKVSYHLSASMSVNVLPHLNVLLQQKGLECKLIYSGDKDLDILPLDADKGLAVQFLQEQWRFNSQRTVVCGDSGNDIALFEVEDARGIIVGNAKPELLQWYEQHVSDRLYLSKTSYAAGILEGLHHFEFLT